MPRADVPFYCPSESRCATCCLRRVGRGLARRTDSSRRSWWDSQSLGPPFFTLRDILSCFVAEVAKTSDSLSANHASLGHFIYQEGPHLSMLRDSRFSGGDNVPIFVRFVSV